MNARETLNNGLDTARKNYLETTALTKKAFDEAMATARKTYVEDIATARKAYDEAPSPQAR